MPNPLKKRGITKRLLTNYLVAMVSLLIVSFISLFITFEMQENKLRQESVERLRRVSDRVGLELEGIEQNASGIVTNMNIQRQLVQLYNSESQHEREQVSHTIKQILSTFLYEIGNKGIDCILFTHIDGTNFREELLLTPIDTEYISRVNDLLISYGEDTGLHSWLLPDEEQPYLVFARTVESVIPLASHNIGILGTMVSLDNFISRIFGIDNYNTENFFIVGDNNRLIYGGGEGGLAEAALLPRTEKEGYLARHIDGERYLVSYTVLERMGWKFVKITPYKELVADLMPTQTAVFARFLIIYCIILLFSVRQMVKIAVPVERLSHNLHKVGGEILSQGIPNITLNEKTEKESSLLEWEFYMLVERINGLITSNYEKQIAIREWEIGALRAQINPHFLYNTLDTITWLAVTGRQEQVPDMVRALANLLRGSIDQGNFANVERECRMLRSYVSIQQVRYKELLSFSMDVDPGIMNCLVPCMILQPLTENSIKHVLEEHQTQCDIRVCSRLFDDYFELVHADSGRSGFAEAFNSGSLVSKGTGIGLKNIDRRIKQLCGKEYGLFVQNPEDDKKETEIILRLPYGYEEKDFIMTESGE